MVRVSRGAGFLPPTVSVNIQSFCSPAWCGPGDKGVVVCLYGQEGQRVCDHDHGVSWSHDNGASEVNVATQASQAR